MPRNYRLSRKSRKLRKSHRKLQKTYRKQRGAGFFNTLKNRVGQIFGSKVEQEPIPLTAKPLPPLPLSREPSMANIGNSATKNGATSLNTSLLNINNYVPPMPPNKNNSGNNNWVMIGKNTY